MKEIAAGLATLGRGPDTMLVHMVSEEVAGLQQLALAHGGSLTTNPHTGLPEAGFLKNILPTVLGVGLSFMGVPAWAAGLGVGGLQAARTGDLGKGLMAGLGAFGGAGLGRALSTMGGAQAAGALTPALEATSGNVASDLALRGLGGDIAAQQGIDAATAGFGRGVESTLGSRLATAGQGVSAAMQNPAMFGKTLLNEYGGKLGATAAGIGALGAMGGFDQPQSGFAMPGQERSNVRLSGSWKPDYVETESGMYTPGHRYFPDYRYRGSFAEGGETRSVPMLEDGGFVLTKKAVDGLGGQQAAKEGLGAIPIKGPGTGTSDSIPTSIDGVRPALVSNGEAYIPKREVKRRGGAKKFYALMRAAERNAARA